MQNTSCLYTHRHARTHGLEEQTSQDKRKCLCDGANSIWLRAAAVHQPQSGFHLTNSLQQRHTHTHTPAHPHIWQWWTSLRGNSDYDDCKQPGNYYLVRAQHDLIYSYAYYILIINAENIANCKSQNFLLLLSSILLLNNDLCTGRQTERRRRELKTAVKSNGQIAL